MRVPRGRNLVIIIVVVVVVVVLAGVGLLVGRPAWQGRCSASFAELPADDLAKLHAVPLDQVTEDDFDPPYRANVRNLLTAAQHPVSPLGSARHAVVVPHQNGTGSARLANSNDGDVRFAVGAAGLAGSVSDGGIAQVDDETGRASWGRRQVGYAAGGGDVGDRLVLMHIPNRKAPRVTAVGADGKLAWCTELGQDTATDWRPTFRATGAGDALFTVRGSDAKDRSDTDVRLSRIDTESGRVVWDQPLEGVSKADSLELLHDQLLVSEPQGAAVVARSAADGAGSWTYRGPDDSGWINTVVGSGKDTAVVIAHRSTTEGNDASAQSWMIGLDRSGKQLWKQEVRSQDEDSLSDSFLVTDDLVVSHEVQNSKTGTSMLVARNLDTGAELWRAPLAGIGSPLRSNASEVVGNSLLAGAYHGGLIAVDLRTGAVSNPLPGPNVGPIDGIVSDGRTVTIDANGLFITFDRTF